MDTNSVIVAMEQYAEEDPLQFATEGRIVESLAGGDIVRVRLIAGDHIVIASYFRNQMVEVDGILTHASGAKPMRIEVLNPDPAPQTIIFPRESIEAILNHWQFVEQIKNRQKS